MYRVYVIDYDGRYIEMDVDELEFGLDLAIADLQNLSIRTGSRTKEIVFKGTPNNNNAFGYIYRLGRDSNLALENKLFFNYNSFRPVDCLIYKDTALVFRGTLRLIEILRQRGVIYYSCVVTDAVIDLMKYLQERRLDQLDLSGLQHIYNVGHIIDSWDTRIQVNNGGTYSYQPFELGKGYVYPYLDYGLTQTTDNQENMYNFRPAMYVNEVIDRIFDQPGLVGYTWELKANPDFSNQFKSLIIPNNQEVMKSDPLVYGVTYSRTSGDSWFVKQNYWYGWVSGVGLNVTSTRYHLNMGTTVIDPPTSNFLPFEYYDLPLNKAILNVTSTIESDAEVRIDYTVNLAFSGSGDPDQVISCSLWERDPVSGNYTSGWNQVTPLGRQVYNRSQGTVNGTIIGIVPKRTYNRGKQISVALEFFGTSRGGLISATASLHLPYSENTMVVTLKNGNEIRPTLPAQVKQYDFLKSIMLMFNLYAYVQKERPKHIIFQPYDEFYALFRPDLIKTVALDWSNKIIYSEDFKKVMNLTIPKSYVYTYKDDRDWINTEYKEEFNDIYSTLRFQDIYGVQDEKKLEVIFSPSPMVYTNDRYHTLIRYNDDNEIKPVSSNIRILHYNGVKPCREYYFVYDDFIAPVNIDFYGEATEYYRPGTQSTTSLQWTLPNRVYFPVEDYYTTLSNLYSTFHIGQTTELTDEDLYTIDCRAVLTDVDISQFDFKTPIFISTDIGNNYFKVIRLSWKDDKSPASLLLQAVTQPESITLCCPTCPTSTTSTTTSTTTDPSTTTSTTTETTSGEPAPRPERICLTIEQVGVGEVRATMDYLAGQLGYIECWYDSTTLLVLGRLIDGTWSIKSDETGTGGGDTRFTSTTNTVIPMDVVWVCAVAGCPWGTVTSVVEGPCPTTTTTSTTTESTTGSTTTTSTTTESTTGSTTTTSTTTESTTGSTTTTSTTTESTTGSTTTTSTTTESTTEGTTSTTTETTTSAFGAGDVTVSYRYWDSGDGYLVQHSFNGATWSRSPYTTISYDPGKNPNFPPSQANDIPIISWYASDGLVQMDWPGNDEGEFFGVTRLITYTYNGLTFSFSGRQDRPSPSGIPVDLSATGLWSDNTTYGMLLLLNSNNVVFNTSQVNPATWSMDGTFTLNTSARGVAAIDDKKWVVSTLVSPSTMHLIGQRWTGTTPGTSAPIESIGTYSTTYTGNASKDINTGAIAYVGDDRVLVYDGGSLLLVCTDGFTFSLLDTQAYSEMSIEAMTLFDDNKVALIEFSTGNYRMRAVSVAGNNISLLGSLTTLSGFGGLTWDISSFYEHHRVSTDPHTYTCSPTTTSTTTESTTEESTTTSTTTESTTQESTTTSTTTESTTEESTTTSTTTESTTEESTTTSTTTESTTEESTTTSTTTESTTEESTTTSTTTESTTEESTTTSTTTESTTEESTTTSTTTESTTEESTTTSTTTESTTEETTTTSTTTESTTEETTTTTSTTTESTTEGTTSTTTTTTTAQCYEWTASNYSLNQEGVFWIDCCTGMEMSEFLDPNTQTTVCARQQPTGNVTITGGTFPCNPECTTTTSTTTESTTGSSTTTTTTTEGSSTTTTTTTQGSSTTTTTTTQGSTSTTTTTTTACCYYPLYFGETLAQACINQTNAEFLVNGYFNCEEPLAIGDYLYTDCTLETGLPNGYYWYDANTVYQITDESSAGQIETIPGCDNTCLEYRVENNTEITISVSWYDCSGGQQTYINLPSGNQTTFCANTFFGPINPGGGTLFTVGPCSTTTTTSTTTEGEA